MSEKENERPRDEKPQGSDVKRKPYTPPRILSREPLEAVAGVCTGTGKSSRTNCPIGPISS
jgi:hypothetical protein